MRVSVAPNLAYQFPIYDAAAVPAWTAFGLSSLAATSIASRTPFVVCVPIASATPSSLQGRIGFAHTLRVITALSVPHSVASGCALTPSGSPVLRHGHKAIALIYAYTFGIGSRPHIDALAKFNCQRTTKPFGLRPVGLSRPRLAARTCLRDVRHPWVFVPHPTNGTPMDKNANRPRPPSPSRRFTVGKIPKRPIFTGKS